jgi:Lrp/AsnC family leucine-responsive transcriptional regulator
LEETKPFFMEALDEIDKALLRRLQQNAKATTKELAIELNLTISPIYERIKKLEKLGYIKEYVAVLDKIF